MRFDVTPFIRLQRLILGSGRQEALFGKMFLFPEISLFFQFVGFSSFFKIIVGHGQSWLNLL